MTSELTIASNKRAGELLPLPSPRSALNIRPAVLGDLPFIDGLQKKHAKAVGFMPTAQFEGHIKAGKVLVAEESAALPVGYLLAADRYFKRDDVGIIYQMNVLPERQRGYVAAAMLKAQFERSAYGCKLYCCWCAQDLAANRFWEAMGFVPLAFRTGGTASGRKPARMHIFWQKRIRQGDDSTPWWFPGETSGGGIKENRIVLPIPPGTHWSEAKPIVLPTAGVPIAGVPIAGVPIAGVPIAGVPGAESVVSGPSSVVKALPASRKPRVKKVEGPVISPSSIHSGGLRFGAAIIADAKALAKLEAKPAKKERQKNDPRLVAAARELKDRWLEELAAGRYLPGSCGKFDVGRSVGERAKVGAGDIVGRIGHATAA